MAKVLIAGGAGFIGSHYVRSLVDGTLGVDVDRVHVLDKLTYAGNLSNLAAVAEDPRYSFAHGDICDGELLDEVIPGHDVVVNFAAETHVDRSITGPQDFIVTNVVGTQALLDACRRHGIPRVVHIGTDEVYGSIDEGSWTEDSPLQPNSPYAASKASAELLVRAYHRTYGMDVSSTRCSNNYGPYQFPEKVIPLFVTNLIDGLKVPLYGDGLNVRDWLHVDDHIRGIQMTNRQLTERILQHMGVAWDAAVEQVPDRLGHDRRYSVDDARLRALGYTPTRSFDEAIDATISWYRDNPQWWRPLKGAA